MKKINLLFDAKDLSISAYQSGIGNVAHCLLADLIERPEVEAVTLYLDKPFQIVQSETVRKLKLIIRHKRITTWIINLETLINTNKTLKKKRNMRLPFTTLLIFLKKLQKQLPMFSLSSTLEKNDAYISTRFKIPKEIMDTKTIKKYAILYDIIPLVMEEYRHLLKNDDIYDQLRSTSQEHLENCHYFSISQYTKDDVLKYFKNMSPENITVAPLGTSDKFYVCNDQSKNLRIKEKYGIPKDKKYVLYIGTLDFRKNVDFAIKNFLNFLEKHHIDDLVFVMPQKKENGLKTFLEDENFIKEANSHTFLYQDKVISIPFIDSEDMASLYSFAEIFVFPSLYEGFGLPVLEAQKCGCPVITSNTTSLSEVAKDAAIMVNPHSDEEMTLAYEKILLNENLKEELKQKGLANAKTFTWNNFTDIVLNKMLN